MQGKAGGIRKPLESRISQKGIRLSFYCLTFAEAKPLQRLRGIVPICFGTSNHTQNSRLASKTNELKKYFLIGVGFLSLGLGTVGIFLPVLPTTPFLLLSSYCFLKSSRRLHERLLSHKVLGAYIKNFQETRTIPRRAKAYILITLWASIGLSFCLVNNTAVRILLPVIALAVSLHILHYKSR